MCKVRANFLLDLIATVHISFLRTIGDNLREYTRTFCIDGNILNDEKCIPYKYYVTEQPFPFEFLHGVISSGKEVVNRCLQVPEASLQFGGMWAG